MRPIFRWLALAVTVYMIASAATAHHSPAMYDREREITLRGVVTRFTWSNPHVYIQVATEDDASDDSEWTIEGPLPNVMGRIGWSSRSLAAGDRVTVVANPVRNGDRSMAYGQSVLKEDGTLLDIPQTTRFGTLTAVPATPFVASGLSGRWLTRWNQENVTQFVQPLTFWSLTGEGVAAVESYDDSMSPANDCVSEPLPWSMLWPVVVNIDIGDEVTTIQSEHPVNRTVHMNIDSHDGASYAIHGHSIGRWEDDVLVVDTTHFSEHRRGNGFGLPNGTQKHLLERFELNPDGSIMTYSYQFEDPDYLAEPVTGTMELVYRPDLPFVSVPCDPESARRYLDETVD